MIDVRHALRTAGLQRLQDAGHSAQQARTLRHGARKARRDLHRYLNGCIAWDALTPDVQATLAEINNAPIYDIAPFPDG